eukprot:185023-Pleurochrysis_carterae.AAC.2
MHACEAQVQKSKPLAHARFCFCLPLHVRTSEGIGIRCRDWMMPVATDASSRRTLSRAFKR